jgi:hypothetical protein
MLNKKNEKILSFLFWVFSNANSTSNNTNDDTNNLSYLDDPVRWVIIIGYFFLFCVASICIGGGCIAQCVESYVGNRRNKRAKENNNVIELETLDIEKKQDHDKKPVKQIVIKIGIPDETTSDESENENKSRLEIGEEVSEIFNNVYRKCGC